MKKRFLLTSALMLLLTVLALTSATYAWFTMSNTNRLNDFTITTVSATGGLEISLDGQRFSSTDVSIADPALNALDVTSYDGINFYKKESWNAGMTNVATLSSATANSDYFEYVIYFRTTNAGQIYLNLNKSYIVPETLKNIYVDANGAKIANVNSIKKLAGSGDTNQSSLGAFTRDWIAAATKVSFMVTGYQNSALDTYTTANTTGHAEDVANKFKHLGTNFDKVALQQDQISNAWDISLGDSRNYNIYGTKATATENIYELDTNKTVNYDFAMDDATVGSKVLIAEIGDFTGATSEKFAYAAGNNAIVKVTMRIWIEGQDLEAKVPLAQGKFTSAFTFDFVQKAAADSKIVSVSGTNYVYSTDNYGEPTTTAIGLEWAQVSQGIQSAQIWKKGETDTKVADLAVSGGAITGTSYQLAQAADNPANGDYYLKVVLAEGYVFADNATTKDIQFVKANN